MQITEPPPPAVGLNCIISFFAFIMLGGFELFLAFADFLARHAAPFDPYLPVSLAYIIIIAKNILVKTAIFFLVLSQIIVLLIAQIYRLCYGDNASSSSDIPDDFQPTTLTDSQESIMWQSPPSHKLLADINLHPAPPDSHAAMVVNAGITNSLPASGHDLENETRLLSERHDGDQEALNTQPLGHPSRLLEKEQTRPTSSSPSIRQHQPEPEDPIRMHGVAVSLLNYYQQEGGPAVLGDAIQLFRRALTLVLPSHPNRVDFLNNLACAIMMRYERNGVKRDLEEAIQLNGEALSIQPPYHPQRSNSLSNLANGLFAQYKRDGAERDLLEAIRLDREALYFRPPGHPSRSSSLSDLASAVRVLYERNGAERDLLEAIQLNREALSIQPPGHRHRANSLNSLANVVRLRYERNSNKRDLLEAIQLNREALSLRPPRHPNRFCSLTNLASAILTRFERDGAEGDLSEAIQLHREALFLLPSGHPDRSGLLHNLTNTLFAQYKLYGAEQGLSEAIQLNREALSIQPPGHPDRAGSLNNLAHAVLTRYERDGAGRDLSEAIQLNREALSIQPLGHSSRSGSLNSLANAVQVQYERDGAERDLSEAIQLNREALCLQPAGHSGRSGSLTNLANTLLAQYERDGVGRDLLEAIQLHREALSSQPQGRLNHPYALSNLANSVLIRHKRDGAEQDLSEAIHLHKEALSLFPPSHPNHSSSLTNLANAVLTLYRRNREEKDLEEAIQLLRVATAAKVSPIPCRIRAAFLWVDIAVKHDQGSALNAYQSAFVLMGSALALGRSLQDRRTNLLSGHMGSRPTKGLALDAALWALSAISKNPKLAIEFLDQGRNVLLASLGQFRADLADVRQENPALADDFHRISRMLDSAILNGQEISEGTSAHEDATSRYKRVSAQWEGVVGKIRLIPGCESFLLPVPYAKLQEAAVGGPVIVILVGKERTTAIIVLPKGEPHTIDLPKASEEALRTLYQEMDYVLEIPNRAIRGMGRVLSDLWEILVQPIIQELQDVLLIPTGSRIWWYPTSWASFFPLHAAGSYRKGGLNLPSLYISSYTPTLQALRRSRGRLSSSSDQTTGPLVVSQAQTPGEFPLPSVDDELGIVFSLVPDASLLADDEGTKENVLNGLRSHSWIHLACHGHPDLSDPFKSHFALHDGPLSLQDIITNDLPSADFAFLSACHSAAQDRTLPDEGLALAGGMQFAGFKSVVGTLWEMADDDAPTLAEEFYKGLAARSGDGGRLDCTKAAESLHDAVKELKKQKVPLYRWINLVHYGI